MSAADTARVLEDARYHLLDRGIAGPSGWDIALVLMGHMDITPSGPQDEARQVLVAAAERLAAQGIGDPIIPEVRTAVVRVLEERCRAAAS